MTDNNYNEENINDVLEMINQEKTNNDNDNMVFTVLEKYR